MEIHQLTPIYAVSPQINPEDLPDLAKAGFTTIINNRPCNEIPMSHQADAMKIAAEAAGLNFIVLPATHAMMNPSLAAQQKEVCMQSDGPVLAYCASGTRCTIIWAMMQAGDMDTCNIVNIAANHGYDLRMMRDQLNSLAGN
ncbi:MAG: TIGR01244 family sulfur transferase [Octadecabacter sp.]|nr:TIGR01244 family sulfur transferase [Octadecabacter sp.]